jgi:hypothetical protein
VVSTLKLQFPDPARDVAAAEMFAVSS